MCRTLIHFPIGHFKKVHQYFIPSIGFLKIPRDYLKESLEVTFFRNLVSEKNIWAFKNKRTRKDASTNYRIDFLKFPHAQFCNTMDDLELILCNHSTKKQKFEQIQACSSISKASLYLQFLLPKYIYP